MPIKPTTTTIRQVARWGFLAAFVCLSLMYLNSALYSAWASFGPPTPYPLVWARRAAEHLSFSGASLFAGLGLFFVIRTFPKFKSLGIIFLLLAISLVIAPLVGRFVFPVVSSPNAAVVEIPPLKFKLGTLRLTRRSSGPDCVGPLNSFR